MTIHEIQEEIDTYEEETVDARSRFESINFELKNARSELYKLKSDQQIVVDDLTEVKVVVDKLLTI